jgi:hypothetical protein
MKAVTVAPGTAGSVRLEEVPEPDASLGSVVVEALAAGICYTDTEIASASHGRAPAGRDRLILGHESLGRVVDPGPSGFAVGEHVVGIVRRPDPAPCPNCAVGEWDMCSQWPLHRARYQAGRRVHGRALADRTRLRGTRRQDPEAPSVLTGRDWPCRQGLKRRGPCTPCAGLAQDVCGYFPASDHTPRPDAYGATGCVAACP